MDNFSNNHKHAKSISSAMCDVGATVMRTSLVAHQIRDNYLGQLFHLDKHARGVSQIFFHRYSYNISFVQVSLFLSLSQREKSLDISLSIAALLSDDRVQPTCINYDFYIPRQRDRVGSINNAATDVIRGCIRLSRAPAVQRGWHNKARSSTPETISLSLDE